MAEKDDERMRQLRETLQQLRAEGRHDLILQALTVAGLEELQIEAAKAKLRRLHITEDFRILLVDRNVSDEGTYKAYEVAMTPVHKAVYLFFLRHPEGLEFKQLADHSDELAAIYRKVKPSAERESVEEVVAHLTNPADNAINEKCSRIRSAFLEKLDTYTASYYIISSHNRRHVTNNNRIWYERLKIITLPRELVTWKGEL